MARRSGPPSSVRTELVQKMCSQADKGDMDAQYWLGSAFLQGHGVKKDVAEGIKWLQLAADQGQPNAQFFLSACYGKGSGRNPNCNSSVSLATEIR